MLEKVARTVAKQKIYKISASKCNLKVQNIYINHFGNLKKHLQKTYYKTALFRWKGKKMPTPKVAQNVAISLGYFVLKKS